MRDLGIGVWKYVEDSRSCPVNEMIVRYSLRSSWILSVVTEMEEWNIGLGEPKSFIDTDPSFSTSWSPYGKDDGEHQSPTSATAADRSGREGGCRDTRGYPSEGDSVWRRRSMGRSTGR